MVGLDVQGRLVVLVSENETRGISWCELQEYLVLPESKGGLGIRGRHEPGRRLEFAVVGAGLEWHSGGVPRRRTSSSRRGAKNRITPYLSYV